MLHGLCFGKTGCQSLRDLERFAIRHHAVLTEALGVELRRPPSDSSFRYFFQQVDVPALCGAADLDQLVCDGKTLRGSIEPTAGGGSAFIAQVTLYSAALGVAISQACYATGENHERAVLRQLLGELDLEVGHDRDITWTLRAKQVPEHISEAWIGTSWIVEVTASGTHDGKPVQATHLVLTSLRTATPSSMGMPTATGAMAPA